MKAAAISPASAMPATALPEVVLDVRGLGKEYQLYDSPRDRLKSLLTGRAYHRSHWALQDVSFSLHRGQCLGVVGNNGAGKSSLLKLLAGTLQPSQGSIHRIGRVTAILELGAGFHPDFTGRENLVFAGSMMGFDAAQMAELEPGIISFSELGDAMDRPVKTYSSGMVVRLAFALVTAVEPDVLIIDEALAVGDQHFQKKCVERIDAFRQQGCTVLFCSHSLYHVRHLCDAALWLDGGRVAALGETEHVLASYEAHVRAQEMGLQAASAVNANEGAASEVDATAQAPVMGEHARAGLVSMTVANLGQGTPALLESPHLQVTVEAFCKGGEMPSIGVMLEQAHGVGITSVATHADGAQPVALGDGKWRATLTFPDLPLHTGEYVLSAYLFDSQGLVVYEQWPDHLRFKHVHSSLTPGLVRLPHHWS